MLPLIVERKIFAVGYVPSAPAIIMWHSSAKQENTFFRAIYCFSKAGSFFTNIWQANGSFRVEKLKPTHGV
jgi:hypothetical protein